MPCSFSFLSVCSGIEAASVAWEPLGWKACAFAEIEKFPSAVLAHHWPETPNLGDMTKHNDWPDTLRPNLIVGGTPCQAFSVAGLRQGLADPRGNLTLVFLGLLAQFRPHWVVWENVPGVLSDRTGAFGSFLGGLGELGYGFAYRVLDAQYYGVAQRRRRVFVVGYLGDWRRAAAVLFEPESMRGDSPPRRESGQRPAAYASARTEGGGGAIPEIAGCLQERDAKGADSDTKPGHLIPVALRGHSDYGDGLPSLRAKGGDCAGGSEALVSVAFQPRWFTRDNKTGGAESCGPVIAALSSQHASGDSAPCVAFATRGRDGHAEIEVGDEIANALRTSPGSHYSSGIVLPAAVRRLTPRECERLQGFPDDHTLIPWRGKMAPEGPRYKALGNSMAVPVMRWIGERISQMNDQTEGPA